MKPSFHTPMPWRIQQDSDTGPDEIWIWGPEESSRTQSGVPLVTFEEDPITPKTLANAHLISAAPEMLEQLIDLVEKIEDAGWHKSEISEAKEVIDKATGKEN